MSLDALPTIAVDPDLPPGVAILVADPADVPAIKASLAWDHFHSPASPPPPVNPRGYVVLVGL